MAEASRFTLDAALAGEIRARTLGEGFIKIVQSVRRGGKTFRISMRPVEIGGERKFQAEMVDEGQVQVKNFTPAAAAEGLEEIIAQKGARELHLITTCGDLHVRVTKKGKALVSRSAPGVARKAPSLSHDRSKNPPLERFDSAALLRITGIADGEGRIRASMRGKYDQVNEFLRMAEAALKDAPRDGAFTIADCGCGKAYLTLALHGFLSQAIGFGDVRLVGIDRRADVVAAAKDAARRLDIAEKVRFEESDLADAARPEGGVDMVVSLHACDTATDEALAKGVEWGARYILSAPCCQHELQKSLAAPGANRVFAGLLRQNILRERLCDILTDTFRALILRILGYRTQVVEFVSGEATARNIMLRAEAGARPGQSGAISEYLELRDFWKVSPWLETRLTKRLSKMLERYEGGME